MIMATERACGSRSRVSSRRFTAISAATKLAPVRFAPGRLRLATRPLVTGSAPLVKTIGIRPLRNLRRDVAAGYDHGDLIAHQIGRQRRQSVVVTFGPAVLDQHVLALNIAGFLQASADRLRNVCERVVG